MKRVDERGPGSGFVVAFTMFTALPIPGAADLRIDRTVCGRAVLWLPFVGVVLGGLAALPLLAAATLRTGTTGALLGSALAVAALAAATRGLHLDGLADTVDGLGSSAPREQALAIMRKPDIGPFGVVTLVLTLFVKVAALTAVTGSALWKGVLALVLAESVGRLGVVLAAGRRVPSARPGGFGALVAGTTGARSRVLLTLAVAVLGALPLAWSRPGTALGLLGAGLVGFAVAVAWRRHVVRRLGGVTGDVFGSVVELTSVAVLLTAALAAERPWP